MSQLNDAGQRLADRLCGYRAQVTQREYEVQPEAPDLGENVQEDTAATLVGPPDADALDAGYIPPDRPYALDDDQVATRLDTEPEDLDTRLSRERPDVTSADPGADLPEPDRSGRLESFSSGADGAYNRSMDGLEVGVDGGAASAEEAAMHDRSEDQVGITER
jgi:hypothetical protein